MLDTIICNYSTHLKKHRDEIFSRYCKVYFLTCMADILNNYNNFKNCSVILAADGRTL